MLVELSVIPDLRDCVSVSSTWRCRKNSNAAELRRFKREFESERERERETEEIERYREREKKKKKTEGNR